MKKSILIVLDGFRIGGISAINMHLFKTLKNLSDDYEFYLICGISETPENIYLKDFSFCKKIYTYNRNVKKSHFNAFLETIFNALSLAHKAFGENKIDFILLNHPYSTLGIILSGKIKRSRAVCFFHGATYLEKAMIYQYNRSNALSLRIKKILFKFIQATMLAYATKIICCSKYAKTLLKQSFNVKNKIYYLHVPYLDLKTDRKISNKFYKKLLGLDKDALIFLSPSRFEPRKGIHLLSEAIKTLSTKQKMVFIITGPIHNKALKYFQAIYHSLQIANENVKVYFTNEIVNKNTLYHYYLAADSVIVPSISLETLGMVTLEALSLGTPVIGTPGSATQEMLSKIDKHLVATSLTSEALKKSIEWFSNLSARERGKLSEKSLLYVKKFHSQEQALKDCANIFDI